MPNYTVSHLIVLMFIAKMTICVFTNATSLKLLKKKSRDVKYKISRPMTQNPQR